MRHSLPKARFRYEEHCFATMCLLVPAGKTPIYFSAAFDTPDRFRDEKGRYASIVVEILV